MIRGKPHGAPKCFSTALKRRRRECDYCKFREDCVAKQLRAVKIDLSHLDLNGDD